MLPLLLLTHFPSSHAFMQGSTSSTNPICRLHALQQTIPDNLPSLSDVLTVSNPQKLVRQSAGKKKGQKTRTGQTKKNGQQKKSKINKRQSKTNTSNGQAKRTKPSSLATRGPWLAPFETSRHTQQRIQNAGAVRHWAPLRRAINVMQTLLERTPVEHCNSANLVCALTLSAKVRGMSGGGDKHAAGTEKLRQYLWQAIAVLRELNAKDQLTARQICNAAWALAKHYDRDPLLLPPPSKQAALSTEDHFGTAEEWSIHDDSDPAQVVDRVIDELAVNLSNKLQSDPWVAKEGELCMTCWAYGVLRERRRPAGWKLVPQVGAAVGAPVGSKADHFVSNAPLSVRFEQWKGSLGQNGEAEECMDLDPPGPTDQLFDQIATSLCQPVSQTSAKSVLRLQTCKWSELSHVAWAHASHGWSCSVAAEGVLLALASEAAERLRKPRKECAPPLSRDMAQLIWSLGVLQADNFRLTSGLMEVLDGVAVYTKFSSSTVARPFISWSCPDIVQVPLALAHSRIDNQDLLREMYGEALRRIPSSTSETGYDVRRDLYAWEISILIWAQARLHLTGKQDGIFEEFLELSIESLLSSAEKKGGWHAIGIGAQEQANLIWSLTVLEKFRSEKSVRLLQELFSASQEECRETGIIQLEHAHQLWQALFLMETEAPSVVADIESWFRDTLKTKWLQEKSRPKISSARHKALSKVLTDMGVAHFNEHDEDIDVAIVLKQAASWTHETDRMSLDGGMRVAVEFDGPNHFTRILDTTSREAPRPLGHSILKYRLLKRQGWTVVRVPYYEFDRIPFWASMERQRYVQRLLKTHSDLRFSSVDVSEYSPPVFNRQSRFQ